MRDPAEEHAAVAERIAALAQSMGLSVVTAESMTSGSVAVALGAAPNASKWFHGGIVAYDESVKRGALKVVAPDIVSTQCALQMARGALRLLRAGAAVATTGVGGPEPSDGHPAGQVCLAAVTHDGALNEDLRFDGDPAEVVHAATGAALRALERLLIATPHTGD